MAAEPAGRRIIPRRREKNGRGQRESEARQEARARAVVLAQPHRKGKTDQGRRWPIGRMILDRVVRVHPDPDDRYTPALLERVAERYAQQFADLRWVMDSARPYANCAGGGRQMPTPDEADAIRRAWSDTNRVLRDCRGGERVRKAMEFAILDAPPDFDERTFGSWIPRSCAEGLKALADAWGMG